VFQLNAEGLESDMPVLMDGTTVIDKQTKITPDGAWRGGGGVRSGPRVRRRLGDLLGGGAHPGIALELFGRL
jgi:hypothetical protein